MAQTGYTPILIYSTTTASQAPAAGNLTNSTLGSELAINITDGKLFYKDNANAVQVIGWKVTPTSAGGTGLTSYTAGDLLYYVSGTTLSKLAIGGSGYYIRSSGTAPQWSAPAALTKTDDTNVTLTLGGSASTALLNAASLTLGWTGQLAVSRGGTGISSFGAGVATWLGTPSSANLAAAVTDETGSGALVFGTSPTITTPTLKNTLSLQGQYSGSFAGGYTTVVDLTTIGAWIIIRALGNENGYNNTSYGLWIAARNSTSYTLTLISQSAQGNGHGTTQLQMSGNNLQVKNANSSSIGGYAIHIESFV